LRLSGKESWGYAAIVLRLLNEKVVGGPWSVVSEEPLGLTKRGGSWSWPTVEKGVIDHMRQPRRLPLSAGKLKADGCLLTTHH
jgi:hypothetical protein